MKVPVGDILLTLLIVLLATLLGLFVVSLWSVHPLVAVGWIGACVVVFALLQFEW